MAQPIRYAALNPLAVVSVVFGAFSGLSMTSETLAILGIPGVVCGIIAIGQTWKYEHVGRGLARFGVVLSVILSMSGLILGKIRYERASAEFRSESLPSYRRVNFSEVTKPQDRRDSDASATLASYVGQRICLKGYAHYTDRMLRGSFMLTVSGDGSDAVIVPLGPDNVMPWTEAGLAVSGTLAVVPESERKTAGVTYQLLDATIRYSRCYHQIPERSWRGGC